jgi:hypothetical protein
MGGNTLMATYKVPPPPPAFKSTMKLVDIIISNTGEANMSLLPAATTPVMCQTARIRIS